MIPFLLKYSHVSHSNQTICKFIAWHLLLPVVFTLSFAKRGEVLVVKHPNFLTSRPLWAAILNCLVTTSRRECLVENRANMALPNLKCLISRENLHQIGTLFFLHGDGYTAESSRKLLRSLLHREFEFDHLRVIYPQAPDIAYRVATGGEETGVWYERNTFSPTDWERMDSINYSCTLISQLINQEKSRGIPLQNIIVGGFGMGGIIAMHTAYRWA